MQKVKNVEAFPDEFLQQTNINDLESLSFFVAAMRDSIKFSKQTDKAIINLAYALFLKQFDPQQPRVPPSRPHQILESLKYLSRVPGVGEEMRKLLVETAEQNESAVKAIGAVAALQETNNSEIVDFAKSSVFQSEPWRLFQVFRPGRLEAFVQATATSIDWYNQLTVQPRNLKEYLIGSIHTRVNANGLMALCLHELNALREKETALQQAANATKSKLSTTTDCIEKVVCQGDYWELSIPMRPRGQNRNLLFKSFSAETAVAKRSSYFDDDFTNSFEVAAFDKWIAQFSSGSISAKELMPLIVGFTRTLHKEVLSRLGKRIERMEYKNIARYLEKKSEKNLNRYVTKDFAHGLNTDFARIADSVVRRAYVSDSPEFAVTFLMDEHKKMPRRMAKTFCMALLDALLFVYVQDLTYCSRQIELTNERFVQRFRWWMHRQSFEQTVFAVQYSEVAEYLLGKDWILAGDLVKAAILSYAASACRTFRIPLTGNFWKEFLAHTEDKVQRGNAEPCLCVALFNYWISSRSKTKQGSKELRGALEVLSNNEKWLPLLTHSGFVDSDGVTVSYVEQLDQQESDVVGGTRA